MNHHTQEFLSACGALLSKQQLLTAASDTLAYRKGMRFGLGSALAVAIPDSLLQLWHLLKLCVQYDIIILMQAANTGVTGGSTPYGDDYDRDLLIISTRRLKGIQLLDDAQQVIAFPGTSLTELEDALRPFQREPHSVIGSSCIGASVVGGVCNNSGGSLIQRGPAFTEKSLFAQLNAAGELELCNHLGIALGSTPEEIISRLEQQDYQYGDDPNWQGKIWADDYAARLRHIDSQQPTRYNGDPQYLYDSAGCAGKLAVFAVRLPSFAMAKSPKSLYIGSDQEAVFVALRRYLLEHLQHLPIQAEYIHHSAFALTVKYAKHMYRAIDLLGANRIPEVLRLKSTVDRCFQQLPFTPNNLADRILQLSNRLSHHHVEARLWDYHQRFAHHLLLKIDEQDLPQTEQLLRQFFATQQGEFFLCDDKEAKNAFLIRFAVGGSCVYYCDALGYRTDQRLVSFDVALPANDPKFSLELPAELAEQVEFGIHCGHFFCYVIHQDYLLKPGVDPLAFKAQMLPYLLARGAKYPAEHNVGHLYHASPSYLSHLQQLDPSNSFNPGIGKSSKKKNWQ